MQRRDLLKSLAILPATLGLTPLTGDRVVDEEIASIVRFAELFTKTDSYLLGCRVVLIAEDREIATKISLIEREKTSSGFWIFLHAKAISPPACKVSRIRLIHPDGAALSETRYVLVLNGMNDLTIRYPISINRPRSLFNATS